MKQILLLITAVFFFVSCADMKDSKQEEESEKTEEGEKKKLTSKKEKDKKSVLDDHFEEKETEDISKEDTRGWPRERQEELRQYCLQDAGSRDKETIAFCDCQLANLIKIFASYKEAMAVFNKTEDEMTDEEMRKAMQMDESEQNCLDQIDDEEGERDGDY